jgi:plastocyanin
MIRLAAFLLALMSPLRALAGDVAVSVRTPQGQPIANAVVTVAAPHAGPIRFPWTYEVAQQNLQFDPFVLVVPVGADVAFPNRDSVRHHVYSFSPAKTFELKLYGQDETRVVHFDKPGVVPLGCNIHDNMVAFIVVVDTPYAAKTDAAGNVVIRNVPAGPQAVRVWHPYLRAPGNALTLTVTVPKEGVAREALAGELRAPPERRRLY